MASNQTELLPPMVSSIPANLKHIVNCAIKPLLISLVFISLNFVFIWAQFVCIITMAFQYVIIAIVYNWDSFASIDRDSTTIAQH